MAGDETSPPRSYQVSVLDFPAELLGHIFLFLDQQTLLAVSLTNKSFHELCTCVLYRDIDIVHTKELVTPGYNKLGPHAGEHLARSIRKNPELAKHLRELHFAEEDSTPVSPAMEILPRATSLRKLTLLCGWKPVGEMTREGFESVWSMLLGRIRGRLDNLEACSLRWPRDRNEAKAWPKPYFFYIFAHPRLKTLCVDEASSSKGLGPSSGYIAWALPKFKKTPLEFLRLPRCSLNAETLNAILSMPCRLKSLEYSFSPDYGNVKTYPLPECVVTPSDILQILQRHSSSLETLYLELCPRWYNGNSIFPLGHGLSFANFTSLRILFVDLVALLGSEDGDKTPSYRGARMEDILPSTLEVLYLRDLYFYGTCHSDHHTVMNDGPLQLLQQLYDTARTYRAKLPNLTKLILDEYWSDANLECPDVVPWIPDFTEQFARVGIEVQRDITVDHPFALFGLPEEAARMRFKGGCAYFHVHDGGASAPVPLHDVIRERYVRAEVDYDLLNL